MKKILRISVLSVLVLTAMAFNAFSAMAMASGPEAAPVASVTDTSSLKQEVVGTVTAIDATSITINGTVYNLSATTQVQGVVQAGDTVKLEIVTNPDGSLTVYEVAKPDASDSNADVSGTEPASIDPVSTVEPIGTEAVNSDKSNVVEPIHTEIAPDKSGSGLDKSGKDAGNASGHDTVSDHSHPESVDAPSGDGQ